MLPSSSDAHRVLLSIVHARCQFPEMRRRVKTDFCGLFNKITSPLHISGHRGNSVGHR